MDIIESVASTPINKRDTFFDSAKTILMYLVVFAHCIIYLIGGEKNYDTCDLIVYNFLVLILMPLFTFISGYFYNAENSIRKSCLGLFSAFLLFHIIGFIISPPSSMQELITPVHVIWYLLSLCYWRAIVHVMNMYIKRKWIWLVLSLFFMIIAGYIPISREFSFQRTFAYFPFFILGNMMRGTDFTGWVKRQNKYMCGIILLSFIIVLFFYHPYSKWLLSGWSSFYQYPCTLILAPFVKIMWLLLAAIIGIAFLCLIPDIKILSSQGSKTLTVYLLHSYPILMMARMGVRIDNIFYLIVISLVIYFVTNYMHNFKVVRWITCPLK